MQQLIAKSISHLFSPFVVWPVLLLLLFLGTGLSQVQQLKLLLPVLTFEVTLPILFAVILKRYKLISDWEITQVKERRLFFCGILLLHAVAVLIFFLWGNRLAGDIRLTGLILEIIGTIITFFWKISAHMAGYSFFCAVVLWLFGWMWFPVLLPLPLIAWSRIIRKKHTLLQTIAGCVCTLALSGVLYEYFHAYFKY